MSKNDAAVNFSELFSELEEIVTWFDADEVQDIDESLKKFERGAEISKQLKKYLEQTETKVTEIKEKFEVE